MLEPCLHPAAQDELRRGSPMEASQSTEGGVRELRAVDSVNRRSYRVVKASNSLNNVKGANTRADGCDGIACEHELDTQRRQRRRTDR